MITYSAKEGKSHLRSLERHEVTEYKGEFKAFTPDKTKLITYADGQSWLYTLSGTELKTFVGAPLSFTPDGHSLLTIDDLVGSFRAVAGEFPLRLYPLEDASESHEQAIFTGDFHRFTPDGQGLIIVHSAADGVVSTLYSLDGRSQANFRGRFVAFTPDHQSLITSEHSSARLYRLDGTLIAGLRGQFRRGTPSGLRLGLASIPRSSGFMPNGQGMVTSDRNYTWLYDQAGALQQMLTGGFWNFTPDGRSIITYRFNEQSWLYSLEGTLQRTVPGQLLAITPDGDGFVTQFHHRSRLYRSDGSLQATYEGDFLAFTADGQALITHGFDEEGQRSWLYRVAADSHGSVDPSKAIALEGTLLGTIANGQWLVTCSEGIYGPYRLYLADGTLQAISRTWPQATPDGSGVVVSADGQSYIYDHSGREQATFIGTFQSFLPSGEQIVTYSEADDQSRLYDLGGG